MMAETDAPEVCVCAAVRLSDGYIVRGHRHNDCLRTASEMHRTDSARPEQGFMTTRNLFVNRNEGLHLQLAAGVPSANEITGGNNILDSGGTLSPSWHGQASVEPICENEVGRGRR